MAGSKFIFFIKIGIKNPKNEDINILHAIENPKMMATIFVSEIRYANKVPIIKNIPYYLEQKTFPGGTFRNFDSYGHKVSPMTDLQKHLFCDPQTSGGLLVAVSPEGKEKFIEIMTQHGLNPESFGLVTKRGQHIVEINQN